MVEAPGTRTIKRAALGCGLLFFLVWSLFPIYWIVATALKPEAEIYRYPPTLVPEAATLKNFGEILRSDFPRAVGNSFAVGVGVSLASLGAGVLAAFAVARLRFAGRALVARSVVVAYLFPPSLLFIPLFITLQKLGLIDSLWGLGVAYLTFTVPFCTWMLIGYFRTVPVELDEAARLDGATSLQILFRLLLPLSLPAVGVVALFAFTNAWNEFLYALVYVYSADARTFTAALSSLVMGDVFIWGQLMAASVIAILPVLVIYLVAQHFLVEGLAAGGVK